MSDKVIKLSDYNINNFKKDIKLKEYSEDDQIKMIKEKLYEELDEYYEETMKVLEKFKQEFAIFNSTIHIIDNPKIKKDIVYDYVVNIIDGLIEDRNILTCNDEQYKDIRNKLFKIIEENYFKKDI